MKTTIGESYSPRSRSLACAALITLGIGLSACADGTEPSAPMPVQGATDTPPAEIASQYRLINGGRTVVDDGGQKFRLEPKQITGYADNASADQKTLNISGWAAPSDLSRPADVVIAFVGARSAAAVAPSLDRPDLVEGYDRPGLSKAGYAVAIPTADLDCPASKSLAIIALVDSAAAQLKWLGDVPKVVSDAC